MILVTGANGFVGKRIMESRKDCVAAPSLRNASQEEIRRIIEAIDVDTIIHTAAISDTGYCQRNPEESYLANVILPEYIARAAGNRKLICFSSDQVYNGNEEAGPYTEEMVHPVTCYAEHKLEMEERVLDIQPSAVMLRAEWMYDFISPKTNYYLNIRNASETVEFSTGQYRGLTYVREVIENLDRAIALPGGAYNFGSETSESIYEITKQFLAFLGKDIPIREAPCRPSLWMNCEKAKTRGVVFSEVLDGLKRCAADDNGRSIKK